jgi:hypothetical protein
MRRSQAKINFMAKERCEKQTKKMTKEFKRGVEIWIAVVNETLDRRSSVYLYLSRYTWDTCLSEGFYDETAPSGPRYSAAPCSTKWSDVLI